MQRDEVIRIPKVKLDTQVLLHIMIERIKIDICEKLRGQVSDRNTGYSLSLSLENRGRTSRGGPTSSVPPSRFHSVCQESLWGYT